MSTIYPVREETQYSDALQYIFPGLQSEVARVIDVTKEIPTLKRLILFGDTAQKRMSQKVELHFAIETIRDNEEDFLAISRVLRSVAVSPVDLTHINAVKSMLLLGEINGGVELYHKKKRAT